MNLNPLEEEIMSIIWRLEKAFPKEIIAGLRQPAPPYNTVLSAIRKLEKEGWLSYKTFGKSHQYYPVTKLSEYNRSLFSKLYHNFMQANKVSFLSYFMQEEKMEIHELEELVKSLKQNHE